jgi:hypothetical protein
VFDKSRHEQRLSQIQACDDDLARGDARVVALGERVVALKELQQTRLRRRDVLLQFLREP